MASKKRDTIRMCATKEISLRDFDASDFDVIVENSFKITFGDCIAANLTVEGNLFVDCDLHVKNLTVKGNLEVGCSIIADTIFVEGNLDAESIQTNGAIIVNGDLYTAILSCGGALTIKGKLDAEEINFINGNLYVDGDITDGEYDSKVVINGDTYCGGQFWPHNLTIIKGNLNSKKIIAYEDLKIEGNLTVTELELFSDCIVSGDLNVTGTISDERDFYDLEEKYIPFIFLTVKGKYNVSGKIVNGKFIKLVI